MSFAALLLRSNITRISIMPVIPTAAASAAATTSRARALHTTLSIHSDTHTGHDPTVQQGQVSKPSKNRDSSSTHQQSANSGYHASSYEHPHDTASRGPNSTAPRGQGEKGNPEGIGLVDQVGGQSAHARKMEWEGKAGEEGKDEPKGMGGKEESTPPGVFAGVKQAVGLGTSEGNVKQNQGGGGGGVTGTGTFKEKH